MQTFRISYKDIFGSTLTHDLKDKGDTIAVAHENKQVNKYKISKGNLMMNLSGRNRLKFHNRSSEAVSDQ